MHFYFAPKFSCIVKMASVNEIKILQDITYFLLKFEYGEEDCADFHIKYIKITSLLNQTNSNTQI